MAKLSVDQKRIVDFLYMGILYGYIIPHKAMDFLYTTNIDQYIYMDWLMNRWNDYYYRDKVYNLTENYKDVLKVKVEIKLPD